MKLIVLFGIILSSSLVYSAVSTVEITSFRRAANNTRAAEICGKILNMTKPSEFVSVIVDPKANNPGIYNVIVGSEGTFCVSVVTYTGNASARMMNQKISDSQKLFVVD